MEEALCGELMGEGGGRAMVDGGFCSGKGELQIRDGGEGDEGSAGVEEAAGVGADDARPDQGAEAEDYREDRLGKQVSFWDEN